MRKEYSIMPSRIRFELLLFIAIAFQMFSSIDPAFSEELVSVKTYTYKKVGDLEIKADVYRANDERIRPCRSNNRY